jgi:hypothetical protein
MPTPDDQEHAQSQRRRRLEAMVAVGMARIRLLLGMGADEEDEEVGDQVRERVDAVGDQALRLGEHADQDLEPGEQQIDADAHPS